MEVRKNMKKTIVSLVLSAAVLSGVGCSNWNRMTPKSMDGTAVEAEVRKNLTADHITGLTVDVNGSTVTLRGHLSRTDQQKALDDARKVPGVDRVVDDMTLD